jgi:ribosomal protein L11 methyltransferase
MNYKEFIFTVTSPEEYHKDLLINALGEIGFDTFEETESGFKAYIQSEHLDQDQFDTTINTFSATTDFSYEVNLVPQKNWNEVWESNFEPLEIGQCYVRATFHPSRPDLPYEIVIDPKMAFGTGHHETTAMMMEMMLKEDFRNKEVLDMGCGTGILAILASMLSAKHIVAIDNDAVCFESTNENAQLNSIPNISAMCGSKEVIPAGQFDIILANINRNILIDQLPVYRQHLKKGGSVLMSGFYESPDLKIISEAAETLNLRFEYKQKKKDWVAVKFTLSS